VSCNGFSAATPLEFHIAASVAIPYFLAEKPSITTPLKSIDRVYECASHSVRAG